MTEGGDRVLLNEFGTECASSMPRLEEYSRSLLKHEPVLLLAEQAQAVAAQFHETTVFRGWSLIAFAIMANHVHVIVAAPTDVVAAKLIGDLKAYATRRLNRSYGTHRWWTERGSGRLLADEFSVERATAYVLKQPRPLLVWPNAG